MSKLTIFSESDNVSRRVRPTFKSQRRPIAKAAFMPRPDYVNKTEENIICNTFIVSKVQNDVKIMTQIE